MLPEAHTRKAGNTEAADLIAIAIPNILRWFVATARSFVDGSFHIVNVFEKRSLQSLELMS